MGRPKLSLSLATHFSQHRQTTRIDQWLPVYKNVAALSCVPRIALHSTAMAKVRGRRKQLMMQ
jgi:hypothetical protein